MFTIEQEERYARHLLLEGVGASGQKKLSEGRVLIVGAGGLGSPAALYLAAAGVGTIGIADSDTVELSNLQRQILHSTADIGIPKVLSAQASLTAINPHVRVVAMKLRVDAASLLSMISEYDFVLDCTDNFDTKFLINDVSVQAGKPYSHAGILKFAGQAMTVYPGRSACYRCIFPDKPDESTALACSRAGVIGVLPGVIGTIQATEAIKHLLGIGELLLDRIITYDSLMMKFREVSIRRSPGCPVCASLPITSPA